MLLCLDAQRQSLPVALLVLNGHTAAKIPKRQRVIGPMTISFGSLSSLSDVGENTLDPLSALCPISATKRGTIFCRSRRPWPDIGPLASKDYLQTYFALQRTFKSSKFNGLTRHSFLTLKHMLIIHSSVSFKFFVLHFSPIQSPQGVSAASILPR